MISQTTPKKSLGRKTGARRSMLGMPNTEKISEALFRKFSNLIYEKTGIYLKPEKHELLNARLGKRLRATGIQSFRQYFDYLQRDPKGNELVEFINCVSTNFTSFFRENAHFNFLNTKVLPDFVGEGRGKSKEIVLWSAACSSGQELLL